MSSGEKITWDIVDNFVKDRMIDNSFLHKFIPVRIKKRTKILNTEIKKYGGMKNYKQYVKLKTILLRNIEENCDTEDSDLSDIDYNIIHNNPILRAKYMAKTSAKHNLSIEEEDVESNKKEKNKHKTKQTTCNIKKISKPQLSSKRSINIGWQNVIKKKKDTSYFSHNATQANALNNDEYFFEDGDHYLEAQSNDSLNSLYDSEDDIILNIMKSESKQTRQSNINSNVITDKLNSQNDATFNKTISIIENESQSYEAQSASLNKSNIELKSQSPCYNIHLSKSTNLENNNNSYNESNISELKNNFDNELIDLTNESSINKNFSNPHVKHKLLKNVRKNLISVLEEIDSTNNDKNIKKDENTKKGLNCDQSLLTAASSISRSNISCNTPLKKTQINIINTQDSLPNSLLLDQQKDSQYDEDLQNKSVTNKEFNLKSPTNFLANIIEEILPPKKCKNIIMQNEVKTVKMQNFKQNIKKTHLKCYDNDLEERKQDNGETRNFFEEMKNSSQIDQIDKHAGLISSVSQKDKIEENNTNFVELENLCNNQIQQSSKKNYIKNRHLKSYDDIENSKKVNKSPEKRKMIINSPKLNKNKDAEIYSINHEDKIYSIKSKDLYDTQQQSAGQSSTESKHSEFHDISRMQNDRKTNASSLEKEVKDFLRCNEIDKNTENYLINSEDEVESVKSEDSYNIQKLLSKITCTKSINKKYKINTKKYKNKYKKTKKYKKINDIDNNIEKVDNTNIISEVVPTKNDISINCSTTINHDVDNWQTKINTDKINNIPMILDTDEEDNTNYLSFQNKKRLQQQAILNLTVYSDSSESDDEKSITIESSKRHDDSFHISSEDDTFKNEITYVAKDVNGSCNKESYENIHISEETTPISEEITKSNSIVAMKKKIKNKIMSTTKSTCENNLFKSSRNENSLQETSSYENVSNDECSLLDKENIYNKSNQKIINKGNDCTDTFKNNYKEKISISTKNSHIELNTLHYRFHNLQQLIEDENLVVETVPPSFTLADLSENEEVFILNFSNEVLQNNLQGQLLNLKEKTIKFGKNKYLIQHKKISTSCIFATGKKRTPYKMVHIPNISAITVGERQHPRKSNVSNFNNIDTSFEVKSTVNNRKMEWKISNNYNKRKRRKSSDSQNEQSVKKR